ncbi:hypothetical protein F2Q69_00035811 [Brassica cretica]|uniref:Uncharacterized protein n=1 Tax=Brassica cretica TaxID=69181 RepID=A0A8S9SFL3_BRACR|nr:hypothetical protein F2Q69_00035811 [Brassica cretica]
MNVLRKINLRKRFIFTKTLAEKTHSQKIGERLEQGCRIATSAQAGRYVATELSPKLGRYVGVKNGYDEVNIQISAKYEYIKHKPSETYPDQLRIGPSMTIGTQTNQAQSLRNYRTCTLSGRYVATESPSVRPARSLCSNRASVPLSRYVATELEPKLGRNVATELFRNVDPTLVHAFLSTLRCYLPKTVANPFHVSRHSKSSIKLYRKNREKFVLYRKKP